MEKQVGHQPYKIGQVAKRLDISVELIRRYESEGILIPVKTDTGHRVFYESDIHWIHCIRRLIKEQGLNIEGIRRMLALMPCWELRPCSAQEKEACPAFLGAIKPCWLLKDQIPETCRDKNCRECNVYQNVIKCENLKKVLFESPQR